ncbi:MAG: GNAT family N-acetyltransferase [Proteobacteria bacterium]|nr:GNAT family N-acetyltransferase [Pseudomonadota bacterium]
MTEIRPYRAHDLEALYAICLKTGLAGADATALYRDPKLIGHVYAGPYMALSPDCAFVVEDESGVGGYIIGALDTYAFEKRLETEWWPALRVKCADAAFIPRGEQTWDQRMSTLIHHPVRTPRRISENYPSHLHINLLPRLQGQGWGKRLIDRWLETMKKNGSRGVHLGVGAVNARAVDFYRAYGFEEIERTGPPFDVIFFGLRLGASETTG